MVSKLAEFVTANQIVSWLVMCFLVAYFIYKEYPAFMKRVRASSKKEIQDEVTDKSVEARLESIEIDVKEIKEKLNRDYYRMNEIEKRQQQSERMTADSLEEREIIMRALLGALGGLQELGANGPTKKAEKEINDYLNEQAHKKSIQGL